MADYSILGHIANIKYLPESIVIWVDEVKRGYRKSNGEKIDDRVLTWKCIFSGNESKRNYVNKFFNRGSLVQVKGEILPYEVEQGQETKGYTVFIQTMNLAAYPRTNIKKEKMMQKESMDGLKETPNVDEFMQDDF